MVFLFFLQKQHQLTRMISRLPRISAIRILPQAAIRVKIVVRGGALTFQTPFQGNEHDPSICKEL
jgi:hypothetical protein